MAAAHDGKVPFAASPRQGPMNHSRAPPAHSHNLMRHVGAFVQCPEPPQPALELDQIRLRTINW